MICKLSQKKILHSLIMNLVGKSGKNLWGAIEPTKLTLTILGFGNKLQAAIFQSAIFQRYPNPHGSGWLCIQEGGVAMRSDWNGKIMQGKSTI